MKTDDPAIFASDEHQNISEAELRLLFENMISAFSYYRMIYDENGRPVDYVFLAVNRAFEEETGARREDILGKNIRSIYPETEPFWIESFGRVAKTGVSERLSNYSAALGKWYCVVAYSPLPDHVAITVRDITDTVRKQDSLEHTAEELRTQREENYRLAHEEPITGLPNRQCLYEAFAQNAASGSTHFSIAIFAPDNLAEILASYGSVLSDAIMRILAQRLHALFSEDDTCFSMTGTDLVLLLHAHCEEKEMHQALNRAQSAIRQAVEVDGASYYLSASCGVACFPQDGTDRDELIMKANLALYQAKRAGNAVSYYRDQIGQMLLRRTNIRNALPKALENDELELFFQPQIQPLSERLLGFEALLRWHSPVLGEVSPLEFISIAEESRLIRKIGEWVLQNACRTLKQINERFQASFFMAVNVSGIQLQTEHFVEHIFSLMDETQIQPELLELEVTESVVVNREQRIIEKLNQLYACGVRVALDDFGTGFSSLSLLKDLKISTLKVDKTFIQDPNVVGLAKMIVRLGHLFGAAVVAEGVETEEQMRFTRHAGCDRVQGFYHALPMPLESLMHYLETKACR
jgi:diguanylate cyclase (GGDEF)-like protein/PAS domain S-box-containing protein